MEAGVVGRQPRAGAADLFEIFTAIGRNDFDDSPMVTQLRVPKRDLDGTPDEVAGRLHRIVIEHIGTMDPEYTFEFLVRGHEGRCEVVVSRASVVAFVRSLESADDRSFELPAAS
jgi:hypothetical protein